MGAEQSRVIQRSERGSSNFTPKYKIGSQVGKGSFGSVYKVTDKSNPDAKGVVKISVQKGSEQDFWSAASVFQREVEILENLWHDNIVRFVDAITDENIMYLVMEACTGGQVFEQLCLLEHFQETDAAAVIKQMLHAVDYIHGKRIMHRDVKAENFMFAEPPSERNINVVKMIDFGMSSKFEEGQVFDTRCGSRYYMAPEMLNRKYDHRIDMWAMGVLTYLLCSGGYPYKITGKKKYPEVFQPLVWPEHIPFHTETQDFIRKILEHNPDERMTAQDALMHPFAGFSADRRLSTSSSNSDLRKSVRQACKVISTTNHTGFEASRWGKLPITAAKEVARQTTEFVDRARGNRVIELETKAAGSSDDDLADTSTKDGPAFTSSNMPMRLISSGLNASVEDKQFFSSSHPVDVMAAGCEGAATPRGHSYSLDLLGEGAAISGEGAISKNWLRQLSAGTYSSDPVLQPNQMPTLSECEHGDRPQELFQNKYKQEQSQNLSSVGTYSLGSVAPANQMPSLPLLVASENNSGRPGDTFENRYKVLLQESQQERTPTKEKPLKSDDSARRRGCAHSRLCQPVKKMAGRKSPVADQTSLPVLPGKPFSMD